MDRPFLYLVAGLPMMLAVEAQFDASLLNCRPSVVAAALLYAERRQRGAVPFWPSMLAKMTGYEDLTTPELACAVKSVQKLCRKAHYMQLYKTQSTQLALQLTGLPAASQQQQLGAGAGLQIAGVLAQQLAEQQQQQGTVRLASGMQADVVVAAPQLNRVPSLPQQGGGLSLQPSLSGPLTARALSASSSSSSALGVAALPSVVNTSGTAAGTAGMLALRGSACMSPGLMQAAVPAAQQAQVDLALLAQLQLQQQVQEQQRRQQQQLQQQQQQQQGSSLAALSAAGLLGGNSVHMGNGTYALDLNASLRAGLYPSGGAGGGAASCFVDSAAAGGGGDAAASTGLGASGTSPFSLNLQSPLLQQPLQQVQEQQDLAGLENLALTLSALGLHSTVDGHINPATLEAALRQQC
jgi:pentatricopeptide repeat domain-containing protein 1